MLDGGLDHMPSIGAASIRNSWFKFRNDIINEIVKLEMHVMIVAVMEANDLIPENLNGSHPT